MATARHATNPHIPRDKLEAAVDAFLSQPHFSAETRRSYRKTLTALTVALDAAGAEPTAAAIEAAAQLRWGTVAPATWNRHAATIRSFLVYAARHGLLDELDVEDLDLPGRRAVIRVKNGELDYLHRQSGTGHLLRAPLFDSGLTGSPATDTETFPSDCTAPPRPAYDDYEQRTLLNNPPPP